MSPGEATVRVNMKGAVGNPNSPGFNPTTIMVVVGANDTIEWTKGDSCRYEKAELMADAQDLRPSPCSGQRLDQEQRFPEPVGKKTYLATQSGEANPEAR